MFRPVPDSHDFSMLPPEVVERILISLNLKLVLTCRLVNKEFNMLIQSSALVQYFLTCEAAGVVDNPHSSLTYPERLEALENREDAWKNLKPMFETTIRVNHHQSSAPPIYSLTGGAFFLDDHNGKDLHYFPLPLSLQDNPQWIKIRADPAEDWSGHIVNFALSEYEHDLMINVISSHVKDLPDTQPPLYSLDLVLLKFSTGGYHPLARHPQIHVQWSYSPRPRTIPRIVGDNLALVVLSADGVSRDTLTIFDWKTGHKRLQHETTANAYKDLVFVSPELLLVPNLILSHFEVWHIPPFHHNSNPPVQVLSLKIPAISPHYSLFSVGCNGTPNSFRHSKAYFPPRPFFYSRENSIITINLSLGAFKKTRNVSYTLVMHRSALLDTIKRWISPSVLEHQRDLPILLTNEATVDKRADPDDGSVRLDVQLTSLSTMPHSRSSPQTTGSSFATSPTSPSSHITTDSSAMTSTTSSASKYNFRQVQWADWGRPSLDCCNGGVWGKLRITVADFNVRRNVAKMARLRGEDDSNDHNFDNEAEKTKEEKWEKLDHEGVFAEDVYMGLKCAIYHAPDEYESDHLLMDEERLVGLKVDQNVWNESVKVFYIG